MNVDEKLTTELGFELDYSQIANSQDQTEQIRHNMIIRDVVARYPEVMEVMYGYGVHCVGCNYSAFETLEQGAKLHRINLQHFLEDLNEEVFSKD
jgi:hybrid cluster-associated redox disulfide protein